MRHLFSPHLTSLGFALSVMIFAGCNDFSAFECFQEAEGCVATEVGDAFQAPGGEGTFWGDSAGVTAGANPPPGGTTSGGDTAGQVSGGTAAGTTSSGTVAGMEPAGSEPAGVEPAGVEPAGVEPAGIEPAGMEPSGMVLAGMDPAGMNQMGGEEPECPDEEDLPLCQGCEMGRLQENLEDPRCDDVPQCEDYRTYSTRGQECLMTSYMPGANRCDRAGECFESDAYAEYCVAQAPQVFAVSSDCLTISECMGTTEPTFTAHEGNPCDNNTGVCNDMGVCIPNGSSSTQVTCGEQGGGDATCSPDSVSDRCRFSFTPSFSIPTCSRFCQSLSGRCIGSWYSDGCEDDGFPSFCVAFIGRQTCVCEF